MKVKDLLTDSSKWTQGVSARNTEGHSVDPYENNAQCWCLIGALNKCYGVNTFYQKIFAVCDYLRCKSTELHVWNDTHTFDDVRALVIELDL